MKVSVEKWVRNGVAEPSDGRLYVDSLRDGSSRASHERVGPLSTTVWSVPQDSVAIIKVTWCGVRRVGLLARNALRDEVS